MDNLVTVCLSTLTHTRKKSNKQQQSREPISQGPSYPIRVNLPPSPPRITFLNNQMPKSTNYQAILRAITEGLQTHGSYRGIDLVGHLHHCYLRKALIFVFSGAIHKDLHSGVDHLTVRIWRGTVGLGTIHINLVGWDKPNRLDATIVSITLGFPPALLHSVPA